MSADSSAAPSWSCWTRRWKRVWSRRFRERSAACASDRKAPLVIPHSVREAIGRRLRHLSGECNGLLVLASVLGREFDLDALTHVSRLERGAVLELLDEAMEARVVSEVPGAIGRVRF